MNVNSQIILAFSVCMQVDFGSLRHWYCHYESPVPLEFRHSLSKIRHTRNVEGPVLRDLDTLLFYCKMKYHTKIVCRHPHTKIMKLDSSLTLYIKFKSP